MLSVPLPEAPFEHRSVSFRTSLMGRPAGIGGRALPVLVSDHGEALNLRQQPRGRLQSG
jgi:hypothetical protein